MAEGSDGPSHSIPPTERHQPGINPERSGPRRGFRGVMHAAVLGTQTIRPPQPNERKRLDVALAPGLTQVRDLQGSSRSRATPCPPSRPAEWVQAPGQNLQRSPQKPRTNRNPYGPEGNLLIPRARSKQGRVRG